MQPSAGTGNVTTSTNPTAPLVLFAYNRPIHLRRAVDALLDDPLADRTRVIAFSDGASSEADGESVRDVRRLLKRTRGFGGLEIVERPQNLGLARSVIAGVSEVLAAHGRAIVLEDDLVVSPRFLGFMNELLAAYADNEQVFSVTGYNYPARLVGIPRGYPYSIYFSYRASSWGWGTWVDRWSGVDWEVGDFARFAGDPRERRRFDRGGVDLSEMLVDQMEGRVDSWAIRWCYASFRLDRLNAYPVKSLVTNIGLDDSGVHCGHDDRLTDVLDPRFPEELLLPKKVELEPRVARDVRMIFARDLVSRVRRRVRAMMARREPRP